MKQIESKVNVSFKEALNDPNIKVSMYYVLGIKPSIYSIEGVKSIYRDNNNILLEKFKGINDGREKSFTYTTPYDNGVICTVIVTYSYVNKVSSLCYPLSFSILHLSYALYTDLCTYYPFDHLITLLFLMSLLHQAVFSLLYLP